MKDWEEIIKERQLSRKAELPESDWNDFLSRKAEHERAAKRRHRILAAAISIPAAAAVLMLLFLVPFNTDVPDNQVSQNEPSEQPVIADSVDVNPVDSVTIPADPEPEKPVVKEAKPVKQLYAQDQQPDSQVEWVEMGDVAQNENLVAQNHSVTGAIYDFDSAEPIYSAAVMVYRVNGADTVYVGDGGTNDDGEFRIDKLEPGNYVANAIHYGFNDAHKSFTIHPDIATTDLGKIAMRGDQSLMLSEVAVSAVVAKVQMSNDSVMFNSAAYKLPQGTSVEDLIRKLPGVQIDSAGDVTVNGKKVSRLLVNGKEFFNDDKTVALTQLTADMIDKVKAYENQSDLDRQTGVVENEDEEELLFYLCAEHPMIVLNGQFADIDESKLATCNIWNNKVRKRDLARLLGIPARKIKSVKVYDADSAMRIWGEKGAHGVISVVTGK